MGDGDTIGRHLHPQHLRSASYMTFNLFISHSWSYGHQYSRLVQLLDNDPWFSYKNYSVPKTDPIDASTETKLRAAIIEQISHVHVVLLPAGVYASHSDWIKIELDIAKNAFSRRKPILAIKPYGQDRTTYLKGDADTLVNWNTSSIVSAIRELASGV